MLQLASVQSGTKPGQQAQDTSSAHRNLVPQLHALADQLVSIIRAGRMQEARTIARRQLLPPIAWGFLALCLQKHQVPADIVERVLS